MRMNTALVVTLAAGLVLGCASSRAPELLPGIPSGTRLVELAPDQARTLCNWMRAQWGGEPDGNESVGRTCSDGNPYTAGGTDVCISDVAALPSDCPTLADTIVAYHENARDHCDDADFNSLAFINRLGCRGQ